MDFNDILSTRFLKNPSKGPEVEIHTHTHTHTQTNKQTHGVLHSRRPTTVVLGTESRLKKLEKEEPQSKANHSGLPSHRFSKYLYCTYCEDY